MTPATYWVVRNGFGDELVETVTCAVVPFVFVVVVSQSLKNPPPIWWSFMWALPALIVLCAACVMDEIAALRRALEAAK